MTDAENQEPSQLVSVQVKITDLLGTSKVADRLVSAIVSGVGRFFEPTHRRREARADIDNFNAWNEALRINGFQPDKADLAIEDRAKVRMSAEMIRNQINREAVANYAIDQLRFEPQDGSKPVLVPDDAQNVEDGSEALSQDWIDYFWNLAQNATEEELQKMWGAVLARTAAGTANVDARVLHSLSLLSGEEAQQIADLARIAIHLQGGGTYVIARMTPEHSEHGHGYDVTEANSALKTYFDEHFDIPLLVSIGIVVADDTNRFIQSELDRSKQSFVKLGTMLTANIGIVVPAKKNTNPNSIEKSIFAGPYHLTRLGIQMTSVAATEVDQDYLVALRKAATELGYQLVIDGQPAR